MKAIYAGSFDLITSGHFWVMKEAAKLFDELVIGIADNPDKNYMFSINDKREMIWDCLSMIKEREKVDNFKITFTIELITNKFLVNFASDNDIPFIVRGIRNANDYIFESGMRHVNWDLCPDITPVYLIPPRKLCEVSSSMVKGMIGIQRWKETIRKYVPIPVCDFLYRKFKDR